MTEVICGKIARVFWVGLLALLFITPALAKSYYLSTVDQTYWLQPDGSAIVDDVRSFVFNGSFSFAYLEFGTTGNYGTYDVKYLGVWDDVTKQKLDYNCENNGSMRKITWYYSAQDTWRRFRVRYKIIGAVQRYGDVAQFYWKAVEEQHEQIEQLNIQIIPPLKSPNLFKVFTHSKVEPGSLTFANDFSYATVKMVNIPNGSFVEERVLLNPNLFPKAPVLSGQTIESLLNDEKKQSMWERNPILRFFPRDDNRFFGGILIVVAMLTGYFYTYRKYGVEPNTGYIGEYEREPPRDIPPAVVPAILTQSSSSISNMGKAFAATLLEAARLGYITIQETEDSVFFGLIKHTDLIYALTQKGVDLLDGKPITIQPGMRYLEQFEVEALRTAICEAGTGIMVTTDQLVSWAKMGYKQNTNFRRFASDWGEANRKWFVNNYFQLDDKVSAKAAGWFICILIAVGAFGTWLVSPSLIFVLIPVLTFVLLIMGIASLSRRTKEGALEMQRWEAFKRFMTDFSAMNEAGPGLLPLWEKYLVYATALGVATKLLENVKSLAQESNYTFNQVGWFTPMHSDGIDSISSMNFSSLDSLSNAMSNFDSLTAALSSSTSSGGGFSGGGGGGGGGGSSGAG